MILPALLFKVLEFALIILIIIFSIIGLMKLIPKQFGLRPVIGFFAFVFLFIGLFFGAIILNSKVAFWVISIDEGSNHSTKVYIGNDKREQFQNKAYFDIKFGETYIDNLSDKNLIIEPVTYSLYKSVFGSGKNNDFQRIESHSVAKCENEPDFYFEAPESITVKKRMGETVEPSTKRLLRYEDADLVH